MKKTDGGISITVPTPTVVNVSESVASKEISKDPDDIENIQSGECAKGDLDFENREDGR